MAQGTIFYAGDADAVSYTGTSISTTTLATGVAALTLSQDRHILSLVNGTNTTVWVGRLSVRGGSSRVMFDYLPSGAASKWDLLTNKHGFAKGDVIYLYAPTTPGSGEVFISAL